MRCKEYSLPFEGFKGVSYKNDGEEQRRDPTEIGPFTFQYNKSVSFETDRGAEGGT